jgi:addiction module RelE/StbE family toxin
MLKIRYSSRFRKDYKTIVKRGYDVKLFEEVLNILVQEKPLPQKYLDHPLSGNYGGHREYKTARNVLLKNLSGNSAFRTQAKEGA